MEKYKLLEAIQDVLKPEYNNTVFTWKQVADAILATSLVRPELKVPSEGWIKVEDGVPESNGEYLVKFTTGERRMGVVSYRKESGFNRFISHWQPLPSPPK